MKSKITIMPDNIIIEANNGEILTDILWDNNISIRKSCGGHATCKTCSIILLEGKPEIITHGFLTDNEIKNGLRLSCQTKINGDMIIEVPFIARLNN